MSHQSIAQSQAAYTHPNTLGEISGKLKLPAHTGDHEEGVTELAGVIRAFISLVLLW